MTANLLHNMQPKLHYGAFILSTSTLFHRCCLNTFSPALTSNLRLVYWWRVPQVKEEDEEDEEARGEGGRRTNALH